MSNEIISDGSKACLKCGSTERYKSGNCKPCALEATKRWRQRNPDRKFDHTKAKPCKACGGVERTISGICSACQSKKNQKQREDYAVAKTPEVGKWKCKVCGGVERYKGGGCKICVNARSKRYKQEHKLTYKKVVCKKCGSNDLGVNGACKPCARVRGVEYRKNNPHYILAGKRWFEENKGIRVVYNNTRRALLANAGGKFTKEDVDSIYHAQKGKCPVCEKELNHSFHVDHVMPLSLGGTNSKENLQILCKKCNLQKSAKDPIEFMQSKGFLL